MPTLLISAAEPSGDLLAAELVLALRACVPDLQVAGVAGPAMRAAGVEALARVEELSVMGFTEVLGHLGTAKRIRATLVDAMEGTDALVVVDAPDLHLPVARAAKAAGVPAIGWVCPQVWAWRPGRVVPIAAALDTLLCLLDFEPGLFPEGFDARHVGHPVRDRVAARTQVDPNLYGLLPGSRPQERARHLAPFLAAAALVREAQPDARFLMPGAPQDLDLPDWVQPADDLTALAGARSALSKSGTVSLELACMGVPQVVAHRVSGLTHMVGKRLVRGVRHLALPNVLADRVGEPPPLPEFVQHFTPTDLADALTALPESQSVLLDALGPPGAAGRAAAAVAAIMEGTRG
jgi:lipid-A-disaccharide synthase